LFTADGWYWVPSEPEQDNPFDTVSLIYDDRRLLETRVRRLASPRMYSQEPRSRCSRIVGNVTIEEPGEKVCTVRSKFIMIEYRREQQRLFTGTAFHRLIEVDGGIRIAWKRIDLINCDAPLDGITQPF
jgi:3-phenylpropionate/cinnamic acid dioxygenase small subunit